MRLGRRSLRRLQRVEVEGAIDRGAILTRQLATALLVIAPARQKLGRKAARQQTLIGGGAEDHAGPGTGRAGDVLPKMAKSCVVHPILRVEQHVSVETGRRAAFEKGSHRHVLRLDSPGSGADEIEAILLEIGRRSALVTIAVATTEGLAREIIGGELEIAGEAAQALVQHLHRAALRVSDKSAILRRRYAEAIERRRLIDEPSQRFRLEERRNLVLEELALLLERARLEKPARILAVGAREQMAGANEGAEQAKAIEIVGEALDPTPPQRRTPLPIGARFAIEVRANPAMVSANVFYPIRFAEEAVKGLEVGKMPRRAELQAVQGDMRAVEIDRDDAGRIGDQITHHIAAARCDRDDMIFGLDRQGLHVDDRVLPDLGINEAPKCESEKALQRPCARKGSISVHRGAEAGGRRALHGSEIHAHRRSILKARESWASSPQERGDRT